MSAPPSGSTEPSPAPPRPPLPRHRLEIVVLLGSLTAFAPMSIDMYLPALPGIASGLATDIGSVQLTLSSFFLGFALGQALYGPITDRFGRRKPLYAGVALFVLASLGCAAAPSVEALMALRFVQALGACAGVVTSRAMVRDLFDPVEAARVFSALMLVMGVAPILAPLAGGWILVHVGWEAIFLALALFGACCLAAAHFRLPETHDRAHAQPLAVGPILRAYGRLLVDRRYMGYAMVGGINIAGMFAYIAGSPFVFIELYGVSAEHFGWYFGANAGGFILAAQINARLVRRFGLDGLVHTAALCQVGCAAVLLLNALTGWGGLWALFVPLFLLISALGFLLPNSAALAMAPHGRNAGVAAALLGCLQFAIAAVTSSLVGGIHDGTAVPMGAVMAACSALAFAAYRILVGRGP